MSHRVVYAPSFRDTIAAQVDYLRGERVPDDVIEAWFDGLFDRVDALAELPLRYPVDERTTREVGFEVRKLVYGRFVITYHVDEARRTVEMLGMIHGARRA